MRRIVDYFGGWPMTALLLLGVAVLIGGLIGLWAGGECALQRSHFDHGGCPW